MSRITKVPFVLDLMNDHHTLFVHHLFTTRISNPNSNDTCINRLYASCTINYEREMLKTSFHTYEFEWKLEQIEIYYQDISIHVEKFNDGLLPTEELMQHIIDLEFTISDLAIPYYDASLKTFAFDLKYINLNDGETYSARFFIELPRITVHCDWHTSRNLLGFYHPEISITNFFNNDFEVNEYSSSKEKAISVDFAGFRRLTSHSDRFEKYGYCRMFELMLNIEDLTVRKALAELTMVNKSIRSTSFSRHCEVTFDEKLSEKMSFNHLALTPMSLYKNENDLMDIEELRIYTQIVLIDGQRVVFEKPKNAHINFNEKYHVQMMENRVSKRLACKAFEMIRLFHLEAFMTSFDESALENHESLPAGNIIDEIECCNPSCNGAQKDAVKNIVNRTNFPLPYVIFGPPGTGKTSTLVEAVAQIIKLKPSAHILVTANSNAACDEIGERLLNFVPRYKMYRFYSPSFDIKFPERHQRLHPKLQPISNIRTNIHSFPTYEEFYSYNVVICTLVTCGRMITAGISSNHFDFVFIDEAASSSEPLSIIPIAGLCAGDKKINGSIILAGDHMQLQGLVHSYFNERHGLSISLMERVMMLERYQFPFDSRYVTQLTDNYRSHWAILKFSNYHFYHSVLRAKQTKEITDFAIGWEMLPNKNFPLIFHSLLAPSEMEGTSLLNNQEVDVVMSYVDVMLKVGINGRKIEPSDIAIICPYGAQRKRLQDTFKDIVGIEIGTVDAFQGREKLIVILSTVRSQTPTVGFLKNEKRLNVALTRAKGLMIVIGNAETLQKNKLWYKFINFCYKHEALVGERFMLRYRKVTKKFLRKFNKMQTHKIDDTKEASHGEGDSDFSEDCAIAESLNSSNDDSDVSWTYEDFRLKAKTAKLAKWKETTCVVEMDSSENNARTYQELTVINSSLSQLLETWTTFNNALQNIQNVCKRIASDAENCEGIK